jgi:hypothetical protein
MTADLQVTCGTPPAYYIYLPLVMRGYQGEGGPTPTPQPTLPGPTPSPTPGAPVQLNEGFEGGVVPPANWQRVQTNPRQTWKTATIGSPHTGANFADVEYDDQIAQQDEWLLSPQLQLSSGTLTLWSFGSLYWCRDTYDSCDLEVWLVVGTVGGGDDVYVGLADNDWITSWEWAQSTFDLGPYLPGGPVRIGFRYYGLDGAQVGLDDIFLDGQSLAISPAP